jgi:hypothetical protein
VGIEHGWGGGDDSGPEQTPKSAEIGGVEAYQDHFDWGGANFDDSRRYHDPDSTPPDSEAKPGQPRTTERIYGGSAEVAGEEDSSSEPASRMADGASAYQSSLDRAARDVGRTAISGVQHDATATVAHPSDAQPATHDQTAQAVGRTAITGLQYDTNPKGSPEGDRPRDASIEVARADVVRAYEHAETPSKGAAGDPNGESLATRPEASTPTELQEAPTPQEAAAIAQGHDRLQEYRERGAEVGGSPDASAGEWRLQGKNDANIGGTCGVTSMAGLGRECGVDTSERALVNEAYYGGHGPICSSTGGTTIESLHKLADTLGIATSSEAPADVEHLAQRVDLDHGVIAAVSKHELYQSGRPGFDTRDGIVADHAVQVTGTIREQGALTHIVINDTSNPSGAAAIIPRAAFERAWNNSYRHEVVVTDNTKTFEREMRRNA